MHTSARNCFEGRITKIDQGGVNDEIWVTLLTGEKMVAIITRESTNRLGLKEGDDCLMIVKATNVVLCENRDDYIFSCRNVYTATVTELHYGKVATEVDMVTDKGMNLTAGATIRYTTGLKLTHGTKVKAIVKSHHVIVAVKKKAD